MFESDDYDQVLSQLQFPEVNAMPTQLPSVSHNHIHTTKSLYSLSENKNVIPELHSEEISIISSSKNISSPKHAKRKMISNHFNHKSKRKFPGPAGLLSGTLEEYTDETLCGMELLSQDIITSQNPNIFKGIFETPLWVRLLDDMKIINKIDSIKSIKQQAVSGNLRKRKAEVVKGVVETIDRSAADPLVTLCDTTGQIKCTLHRDAWNYFSAYIVSEYCALVLYKPTVLITGSAYKKHYLNITLRNILHIYSSTILNDDENLPEGFVKSIHDDLTIISCSEPDSDFNLSPNNEESDAALLEGLDSAFKDDLF